jgi:hypothetical protein
MHTPGPWIVETHSTKYPDLFTYSIIAPNGYTEPDGSMCRCAVGMGEFDSLEDASLIAAAPDLLKALKELLTAVRHMPNLLQTYPSIDTITAASDAIAKAEQPQ